MTIPYALLVFLASVSYYNYISVWPYYIVIQLQLPNNGHPNEKILVYIVYNRGYTVVGQMYVRLVSVVDNHVCHAKTVVLVIVIVVGKMTMWMTLSWHWYST